MTDVIRRFTLRQHWRVLWWLSASSTSLTYEYILLPFFSFSCFYLTHFHVLFYLNTWQPVHILPVPQTLMSIKLSKYFISNLHTILFLFSSYSFSCSVLFEYMAACTHTVLFHIDPTAHQLQLPLSKI